MIKKIIFYIALLLPVLTYAKDKEVVKDSLYFDEDDNFNISSVPAKWHNESAVVLGQKTIFEISKGKKTTYTQYTTTRYRIYLKDKSAVEEFSEFYFAPGDEALIKIVKPDGTEILLDMDEAISVGKSVTIPNFYKKASLSLTKEEYKKLAISSLNKGDIIDYIFRSKNDFSPKKSMKFNNFGELRYSNDYTWSDKLGYAYHYELASKYPKVKQSIHFEISNDLYFNFKSKNNAPDLEFLGDDEEKETKKYKFEIQNVERTKDQYFMYSDRTYPSIMFQFVYQKKIKKNKAHLLAGNSTDVLTSIDQELIKKYARTRLLSSYNKKFYNNVKQYLKLKKHSDHIEYAVEIYQKLQSYYYKNTANNYIRPELFAAFYYHAFKDRKVDFDIVIGIAKTHGVLEDLITEEELTYGVRIKSDKNGEYVYFFPFEAYSTYDDKHYRLMGTEAYALNIGKNLIKTNLDLIEIPRYEPADNQSVVNMRVSVGKNFKWLNINAESSFKGEFKSIAGYNAITKSEFDHNDRLPEIKGFLWWKIKKSEKEIRYEEHLLDILTRRRLERLEEQVESNYDIQKYHEFELTNTGMEGPNEWLSYKERYNVSDLIKTAGDSVYIFEVGRLITPQIGIKKDDLERVGDVFVDYERIYDYTIEFIIPKGYKVFGLNEIRTKLDNSAGSFESKVIQNKNKLIIRTIKVYKTNYLPESQWPDMIHFLDKAYEFSQAKILLIKTDD